MNINNVQCEDLWACASVILFAFDKIEFSILCFIIMLIELFISNLHKRMYED